MGTDKDIIIAIEFGSSAIRGIAARRLADGNIEILDIEHEKTGNDTILRGVIYNIDQTSQAVTNIARRMSEKLGVKIVRAYVGLAGQSLHTVTNFASRTLEGNTKISVDVVDRLMDEDRNVQYANSTILDIIPQEYIVGGRSVADPVGIQASQVEGHFMNVIARRMLRDNIEKCMQMAGIQIAELLIAPLVLGNALLSESEKRSGCALIDFGASTTTISVYYNNLLRHLAVIPLGGDNITNDIITVVPMDKEEGEQLKRKNGIAHVPTDTAAPHQFPISNDRTIDENLLLDIIGARQDEIISNAWTQIESLRDNLISGIIITGGAAQMKDMTEAVKILTKVDRVKPAKSLITSATVAPGVTTPQGISIDTLVAMVMRADTNCVAPLPTGTPEEIAQQEALLLQEATEKLSAAQTSEEVKDVKEQYHDLYIRDSDFQRKIDKKIEELEKSKDEEPKQPSRFQRLLSRVQKALTEE